MKVYFYSIHKIDVDPAFYGIPFMALSDDHARFMLFDAIRKDVENFKLEDYELLRVGEFDQESGFTSTSVDVVAPLTDFIGARVYPGPTGGFGEPREAKPELYLKGEDDKDE